MKDEQLDSQPSPLIASSSADTTEIESYTQICSTAAGTIRWIVFAIGVCACASLLTLATFYFSNLNFAIERREEIKRVSCTPYNPNPTNNYCEENQAALNAFKKQRDETYIVSLPVINAKVYVTDFPIIVYVLGLFFWYWLWNTLRFTRSMLCGFYNNSRIASIHSAATRTISSYFLLLWSGGARRNLHNTIRYILIGFIVVICFDAGSDIWDYVTDSQMRSEPGWIGFRNFLLGLITVKLIFVGLSIYLLRITDRLIRDLRNLLVLVEWSRSAFYPLIYQLFDAAGDPLQEGANETSYDEDDDGAFHLRIRLKFKKEVGGSREVYLSAPIDLWRQAQKFAGRTSENKRYKGWMLTDDERKRNVTTTFEERRMRRFFFEILVSEEIEKSLAEAFNERIISPRGLEEKVKGLR